MSTSTIRLLQQDVFNPSEERLIACCHVNKFLKKKKASFLCLVSTTSVPIVVSIIQVKQTDKNTYKKKRYWPFNELKSVDGHNEQYETKEFDLYFDKVYLWVSINPRERYIFIHNLWKQSIKQRRKDDMPVFKNLPKSWITDEVLSPENNYDAASSFIALDNDFVAEDFKAITDREQEDLKRLMDECEFAISNTEGFMEILMRDLSLLDGENVQSVLASEEQVETLMEQLRVAINEADKLETQLDQYDEILCHIRDIMEKMEKKNSLISVVNCNNQLLLSELDSIVAKLDLPIEYQKILEDADFLSQESLVSAAKAASALKTVMNSDIDKALLGMTAVQEQRRKLEKYKEKFSRSLTRQLNNLFIHYGNHHGELERNIENNALIIPQHNGVHSELVHYTELMHWLKVMDKKMYESLKDVYTISLGKLYDKDIKTLFNAALDKIEAYSLAPPATLIGLDREYWTLQTSDWDRKKYDAILEQVLTQLEPVFLQEQQFCVKFFQLNVLNSTSKNTLTTLDGNGCGGTNPDIILTIIPQKKMDKQIDEDVRRMMSSLFACLKSELALFIEHIKRQDSLIIDKSPDFDHQTISKRACTYLSSQTKQN